jgi:hypothetical protein
VDVETLLRSENVERLLAALPDSGLPADLQDWLHQLFGYDARDSMIRTCIGLSPGGSQTAKCAFFLDCFDGHREHPSATARTLIDKLHECPVLLPRSTKQLRRIAQNRRSDSWRSCAGT